MLKYPEHLFMTELLLFRNTLASVDQLEELTHLWEAESLMFG